MRLAQARHVRNLLLLAGVAVASASCGVCRGFTTADVHGGTQPVTAGQDTKKVAAWQSADLKLQDASATPASLHDCRLTLELQSDAAGQQKCLATFTAKLDSNGWETKAPAQGELGQVIALQLTDKDRKLIHEWKLGVLAIDCTSQHQPLSYSTSLAATKFAGVKFAELRLQPYEWLKCK